MTTDQLSNLVRSTRGTLTSDQFNNGAIYDWVTNNCAHTAAKTIKGLGYDLDVDPDQWALMPGAVAAAARAYAADGDE